ncbi:hypothetical protein PV783_34115 [Chitinophaga sp. CC14]|uniref:hypothetical protein n=1 Tax=Chitinophaga sp. CC14 TaxID=3029199 RepID=UPI003B77A3E0
MSGYINHMPDGSKLGAFDKVFYLLSIPGASTILDTELELIDQGQVWYEDIVAVVETPGHDTALFCSSLHIYQRNRMPDDRKVTWLRVPGAIALSTVPLLNH